MIVRNLMFALLAMFAISVNAQKLPTVQANSLRAPADIKIDGKAAEWNNKFQAYNRATDAFYTIANDDDYIYLTIQVTDPYIINKVFSSGITFNIDKSDRKNDTDAISITYPVIDRMHKVDIDLANKPRTDKDDSVVVANNAHITKMVKWILVTGIKDIDTLTSIYNRDGIKAAGLFDNKMAYTYELALSIKNLGLAIKTPMKLAYHIKFNGASMNQLNGYNAGPLTANGFPSKVHIAPGALLLTPDNLRVMQSTTDFWGEYTLATK